MEQQIQEWQPVETAPKDGREFLVCYPRQGRVVQLVSYNRVHRHYRSKGEAVFLHPSDLWHPLPPLPDVLQPSQSTEKQNVQKEQL